LTARHAHDNKQSYSGQRKAKDPRSPNLSHKVNRGTHIEQYSLHQLLFPSGETTTDPLAIHEAHTAHWKQWFSSPENPNFFIHYEIDWSNPQDSKDNFMN